VAEQAAGAGGAPGGVPDALVNRLVKVKLSDGSEVTVERWAWVKKLELLRMVGDMDKVPVLAEASMAPADRPKISTMADEDVLAVYNAAIKLNVTAGLLKNAQTLGENLTQIAEGTKTKSP